MTALRRLLCGLRSFVRGWYLVISRPRYWMKTDDGLRRSCIVYISGEMRVGDITTPDGVCNPIMAFLWVLHGDVVVGTSSLSDINFISGSTPHIFATWNKKRLSTSVAHGMVQRASTAVASTHSAYAQLCVSTALPGHVFSYSAEPWT